MDNLKPCPFCGNQAKIRYEAHKYDFTNYYAVQCTNVLCFAMSGWARKEEWAIKRWNRRDDNGELC